MNKENLLQKLLKPLKERGRFNSPEEVEKYFTEALQVSYQEGIKEALISIKKYSFEDDNTYQDIDKLLNNHHNE